MTGDDASAGDATGEIADRLRYAPELIDHDRVLEVLAASGPAGRATIAGAIGDAPAADAGRLADAVPFLVETLGGDHDQRSRPFLEAIARIAEADPAAVRAEADTVVEYLTAYNIWESRAATEAFRHVVAAFPEEIDRVEPMLDHEQRRFEERATSVLATVTDRDPTLAADFLDDCVRIAADNPLARESAVAVLANAGWLDPTALDPAVEELISIVREDGVARRGGRRGASDRDRAETSRPRAESQSGETEPGEGGDGRRPYDARDETFDDEEDEGGDGRRPYDARDETFDDEEDEGGATRRRALDALAHVAGHEPGTVQSIVPLCVELAAERDDEPGVGAAAARLLVALALQDTSTAPGDFADSTSYFERMALVEAMADASTGVPGREVLLTDFLDDESQFIRFEAYRQIAPEA